MGKGFDVGEEGNNNNNNVLFIFIFLKKNF